MKILICTDAMGYGGAETHILSLAGELTKSGHRVPVAAPRGALANALPAGVKFVPLPPFARTPAAIGKAGSQRIRHNTRPRTPASIAVARRRTPQSHSACGHGARHVPHDTSVGATVGLGGADDCGQSGYQANACSPLRTVAGPYQRDLKRHRHYTFLPASFHHYGRNICRTMYGYPH